MENYNAEIISIIFLCYLILSHYRNNNPNPDLFYFLKNYGLYLLLLLIIVIHSFILKQLEIIFIHFFKFLFHIENIKL